MSGEGCRAETGEHKLGSGERFQAQEGLHGAKPEVGAACSVQEWGGQGIQFCGAPKAILRTLFLTPSVMGGQPVM